jgi:hypothetical protein
MRCRQNEALGIAFLRGREIDRREHVPWGTRKLTLTLASDCTAPWLARVCGVSATG